MKKTIHHQLFFEHSPESVWEYLTNSDLMELWLMPNNFIAELGHEFEFRTNPIPSLNLDGIFQCKILEIKPFEKLVYSWKAGPGGGKVSFDSIVEWSLLARDNGTELSISHSGFKEIEHLNLYNGMNEGWLKNIKKIDQKLKAATDATTNS